MERSAHIQRTGKRNGVNRQLEQLAYRVACLAQNIRERTITTFARGIASDTMRELFDHCKHALNSDVTTSQFADIFAQTLAYGLLAARFNHSGPTRFQRQHASSTIPITNAFLAKLFATISGPELHEEPLMCYVDELVDLLAETDAHIFLAGSNQLTSQKDALSWLYEKFLEQYDPQLRELRGVYYTHEPVVSYIVRSVDLLLRTHFNRQDGLAGEEGEVLLLDPACGTGIFLQAVIRHIRGEFQKTGNARGWQAYVHAQLLPHLFGFELLMAPYLIAHLKLAMQLAALDMPEPERPAWAYHVEHLNIYLANTLEQGEETRTGRGQAPTNPIMVILGNPPYAGHSANKGQLINALLDAYKEGCPELKKPGQAKWLSDDYVKFMRFAQWRIEQAGYGILAFVTNHSYLDNPTFRGMRRSLLQSFDDVYILDLHGNSKKQEQAPGGSKDENIFDIQQGVAISIFVRRRGISGAWGTQGGDGQGDEGQGTDAQGGGRRDQGGGSDQGGGKPRPYIITGNTGESCNVGAGLAPALPLGTLPIPTMCVTPQFAKIRHANLWGLREVYELDGRGQAVLTGGKYCWLAEHDLASTQWTVLNPLAPFYAFAPQDNRYFAEYEAGWSVADIFRPNGDPAPGVVTCHDQFAISWTATEASDKVERFLSTETEAEARQLFRLCSQHQWKYAVAKSELRRGKWHNDITQILYRPFDRRWTIFNRYVAVHRRERVMRHMLAGENIGLTIGRAGQVIDQDEWDIAFCTRLITEFNLYRRGGNNLFPLYLYDEASPGVRKANFAVNFIADCAARLRMTWIADGRGDLERTFGPEDVFTYMYALFYSPTYRKRYAPFLKIDFPRLPLTSNNALFRALCSIGDRLTGLHLMEQRIPLISCFPVPGDNCVEAVRYITQSQPENKGRIWINTTQYFEDVPLEAWKFSIGGYQMCKKWLKDRKGHKLGNDEVAHYQCIVAILAETSRLMSEIDEAIEKYGGWPL